MSNKSNMETSLELQEKKTQSSSCDKTPKDESLKSLLGTAREEGSHRSVRRFDVSDWRILAIIISFVSMFVISVLGVAGVITSEISGSSAELAFSFDALLGIVSSGCVVWRFYKESAPCEVPGKEKKACLFIAAGFVLSAIVLFTRAMHCLVYKIEPLETVSVIIISTLGSLCYALSFFVKFKVAQKLHSVAMRTDSYDSATGALMALGVLVSVVIYKLEPSTWWIDPVIALIIAITTFTYGVIVLINVTLNKGFGEPQEYQQF